MNFPKASIRRLRTGIVPEWEIERLSVAYDRIGSKLIERLAELTANGKCAPFFVLGEWGSGKTHMLSYVRAVAARRGLAHVSVTLNPRSAALNYPQRFYPTMAEAVTWSGHRGLRAILSTALSSRATRHAIQEFAESEQSGSLSAALRVICARYKLSQGLDYGGDTAWNILLGADLAWSTSKRPHALNRMREMAALMRVIGSAGMIAVFDEAESIDQLFNRLSRSGAYETLGSLCAQNDTLCIFGITRRFQLRVAQDATPNISLFSHIKSAANFLTAWQAGRYSIVEPPQIAGTEAGRLADLVASIYRDAYPETEFLAEDIDGAVARWNMNPHRNPRRLVRAVIDTLDARRSLSC